MNGRQERQRKAREEKDGAEVSEGMYSIQINQVEQRIKNLQRFMNAELDSLLSQLQHLKDLAATTKTENPKMGYVQKVSQMKLDMDIWKDIPAVLRVRDIQEIMGVGANQAYDLVNSNVFHYVRIGRLIMIPKPGFIDWLEGNYL